MTAEDIINLELRHRIADDITDGLQSALMNVVIGNHKNSFKNQASKQGPILTQNARGGEHEKKFKNS